MPAPAPLRKPVPTHPPVVWPQTGQTGSSGATRHAAPRGRRSSGSRALALAKRLSSGAGQAGLVLMRGLGVSSPTRHSSSSAASAPPAVLAAKDRAPSAHASQTPQSNSSPSTPIPRPARLNSEKALPVAPPPIVSPFTRSATNLPSPHSAQHPAGIEQRDEGHIGRVLPDAIPGGQREPPSSLITMADPPDDMPTPLGSISLPSEPSVSDGSSIMSPLGPCLSYDAENEAVEAEHIHHHQDQALDSISSDTYSSSLVEALALQHRTHYPSSSSASRSLPGQGVPSLAGHLTPPGLRHTSAAFTTSDGSVNAVLPPSTPRTREVALPSPHEPHGDDTLWSSAQAYFAPREELSFARTLVPVYPLDTPVILPPNPEHGTKPCFTRETDDETTLVSEPHGPAPEATTSLTPHPRDQRRSAADAYVAGTEEFPSSHPPTAPVENSANAAQELAAEIAYAQAVAYFVERGWSWSPPRPATLVDDVEPGRSRLPRLSLKERVTSVRRHPSNRTREPANPPHTTLGNTDAANTSAMAPQERSPEGDPFFTAFTASGRLGRTRQWARHSLPTTLMHSLSLARYSPRARVSTDDAPSVGQSNYRHPPDNYDVGKKGPVAKPSSSLTQLGKSMWARTPRVQPRSERQAAASAPHVGRQRTLSEQQWSVHQPSRPPSPGQGQHVPSPTHHHSTHRSYSAPTTPSVSAAAVRSTLAEAQARARPAAPGDLDAREGAGQAPPTFSQGPGAGSNSTRVTGTTSRLAPGWPWSRLRFRLTGGREGKGG